MPRKAKRHLMSWQRAALPAVASLLAAFVATACSQDAASTSSNVATAGPGLFYNATSEVGLEFTIPHAAEAALDPFVKNGGAGGIAEDLDGDFDLDILVANPNGPNKFFRNRGDGTFDEAAEEAGLAYPEDWTVGLGAVDLDNDGDQDVYCVNGGEDRVLRNDGAGHFEDITAATGISFPGRAPGIQFGDLNKDGLIDFFLAGGVPRGDFIRQQDEVDLGPVHLMLGRPDGTFERITDRIGPNGIPNSHPFLGSMIDLDSDGDLDLYIVTDSYTRAFNQLYRNDGPDAEGYPRLFDMSEKCNCASPMMAMGMGVLDLDENGLADVFVSGIGDAPPAREGLLLNRGAMTFADITDFSGATAADVYAEEGLRSVSWAALPIDVENDGAEDLFVVYAGITGTEPNWFFQPPFLKEEQPDALLRNGGGGKFTVATDSGLEDPGSAHAALVADFDGDGCQDVYVLNLNSPSHYYRHRCEGVGTWLGVALEATRSARDAIGARIHVEIPGRNLWRQVLGCSTGVHSCQPKRVHFGLAGAAAASKLTIHWPSGQVQVLTEIPAGQVLRVKEPL